MLLQPGITSTEWTVIKATVAFSLTLQLSWFLGWEKYHVKTDRQRAYVLSLLSSFVTSVGSLPFVYQVLFTARGDLSALLANEDLRLWAVGLTTFFMTFLCLDLGVGYLRYRSKIDLLTGWVHHITYFVLLCWVLRQHYAGIFVAMCVLEIPTFLLALGSVHRPWRNDMLFASTFVSTRILFHAFMIISAFQLYRLGAITIALSAFLPLHCYWFFGFIQQQKRLYYQRKAAKSITSNCSSENSSKLVIPAIKVDENLIVVDCDDDDDDNFSVNKQHHSSFRQTLVSPSTSVSPLMLRPSTTARLRRHLPTNAFTLPSQEMLQRLADRLPLSKDLYRSSEEKLRQFWDQAYQILQQQQQQQQVQQDDPSHPRLATTPIAAH